jgi:hypothetical protein
MQQPTNILQEPKSRIITNRYLTPQASTPTRDLTGFSDIIRNIGILFVLIGFLFIIIDNTPTSPQE